MLSSKKQEKPSVVVIGYGIVGIFAEHFIDKNKYKVIVIDELKDNTNTSFFREPSGPTGLRHINSQSRGSPGNATVWGERISFAVFNKFIWPDSFLKNLQKYSSELARLGFPRMRLAEMAEVSQRLLVNKANSDFLLKKRKVVRNDKKVTLIDGLVSKFIFKGNRFEIEYETGTNRSSVCSDYVLICAGALNSFNILAKSDLVDADEAIQYFDHPTVQIGSVRCSRKTYAFSFIIRNSFIFGRRGSAYVLRNDSNGELWTLRLFPRVSNEEAGKLVGSFQKLFRRMGIYSFIDFSLQLSLDYQDNTPRAVLNSKSKEIELLTYFDKPPVISEEVKVQMEQAIRKIFKGKEMRIVLDWESPVLTASAHYMGLLGKSRKGDKNQVDCHFRLNSNRRVFVPGSISFPESVPGHPTYLAICTALHAVHKLNRI